MPKHKRLKDFLEEEKIEFRIAFSNPLEIMEVRKFLTIVADVNAEMKPKELFLALVKFIKDDEAKLRDFLHYISTLKELKLHSSK